MVSVKSVVMCLVIIGVSIKLKQRWGVGGEKLPPVVVVEIYQAVCSHDRIFKSIF